MASNITTQRVLFKLYELYNLGADFVHTRWYFDWDESSNVIENSTHCIRELAILTSLKTIGVIDFAKLSTENGENPYGDSDDHHLNETNSLRAMELDEASYYYDWAVWLTNFDYQKFLNKCEALVFEPQNYDQASWKFVSINVPVVTIDGTAHRLTAVRDYTQPFKIAEHCLTHSLGQSVTLEQLRSLEGLQRLANIKEAMRRSHFDTTDGLLRDFVTELTPSRITLTQKTQLSDEAKQEIIQAAQHTA